MAYTDPTYADFKVQFIRDFPYGTDPQVSVLDQDIINATVYTGVAINPGLWDTQSAYSLGYLLLTAHYLVLNLRASSQGINGQFNWAQNTKAVGAVSEGFTVPERITANPELMMLTKTNYGAQYLQLILPQLCGQVFLACGGTQA